MNNSVSALRLRQLLYAMAFLLTFEGIVRKAAPSELRVPLFLLKDMLVMVMAVYVARLPLPAMLKPLWTAYGAVIVLMIPSVLMTAWHDPLLAVFGAKQYLLYPVVGFATFLAFEKTKLETAFRFFRWISLLIIPTTILAVLQSRLPSDSWINMSVNGESMQSFSAAGELRVSSTFSFVAQFCIFLNAELFMLLLALHDWGKQKLAWKLLLASLVPALVLSCFITGSRTAVVGNLAIILLATVLISFKSRMSQVLQILLFLGVLYLLVLGINHFLPHATAAYSAREDGHLIGFSTEIRKRVFDSYFDLARDKYLHTFLGNGLGVMSNGSDSFSSYSAFWRARLWTETDLSTTFFEGGYYLAIAWYGFRLFVVLLTFGYFFNCITAEYAVPLAFAEAFVIITGLLGTLALQPPIAIWWWMGVGTVTLFSWKCTEPPETRQKREQEEQPKPPEPKKIRGRSLYADVIHNRK